MNVRLTTTTYNDLCRLFLSFSSKGGLKAIQRIAGTAMAFMVLRFTLSSGVWVLWA
jgi:hypothetical protein